MDAKDFRRLGYQIIDWVADYREGLARLPVMSQVQPGEIRAAFPAHPPQQGGRLDEALAALDRDVMPGITPGTTRASSPISPATRATPRSWPIS